MNLEIICIKDRENNIVYRGKITSIRLPEEIIVAKSIEFFNDKFPCFLHRTAVMKRLYFELEIYCMENNKNKEYEWFIDELPSDLQIFFKEY